MRRSVERNKEELCGWWRNCLKARSCKVIAVWEREGACGGESVCVCTVCSVRSPPYGRKWEEGGGIYIKLDNRKGMSGWSGLHRPDLSLTPAPSVKPKNTDNKTRYPNN